ncbi:hypothetical protein [Variovorax sp.]|uniref:hypothetical protein n=1 Tax=Variovorax sp. TaxID=1871043 RepID=UPI003BAB457D
MSLTARRFADKPAQRIEVPKVAKLSREDAARLPLLDRVLLQEHQRHAARLAEVRCVADKLAALESVVVAAQAAGAYIDIEGVRESYLSYRLPGGRRVCGVVLRPCDTLSSWRDAKAQNAVANALLAEGWRVQAAEAHGSEVSRDRLVFTRGMRTVETTCLRQWVVDAIEAGHITAATAGRHPATDTGTPLNDGRAEAARAACEP